MAGHVAVRECRDDELEVVLALWRQADATVSVTDTLDDVRRAANGSTSVLLVAEQEDVSSVLSSEASTAGAATSTGWQSIPVTSGRG